MATLSLFDLQRYSEEMFGYTELEYAEVMREMAEGAARIDAKYPVADFSGYEEFSRALETAGDEPPAPENFEVRDGKVRHKPEPRSLGRIGGIEL